MDQTGELIRQLRERDNLTQEQLGAIFEKTDKAVSSWERNGVKSKKLLKEIAQYFRVSVDYLKSGKESSINNINTNTNTISAGQTSGQRVDLQGELERLRLENQHLKQRLQDKEELIELLRKK